MIAYIFVEYTYMYYQTFNSILYDLCEYGSYHTTIPYLSSGVMKSLLRLLERTSVNIAEGIFKRTLLYQVYIHIIVEQICSNFKLRCALLAESVKFCV